MHIPQLLLKKETETAPTYLGSFNRLRIDPLGQKPFVFTVDLTLFKKHIDQKYYIRT